MKMAVNPIQLEKFLKGADYPTDKQSLIKIAQSNQADQEVIETLNNMPGDQFNSVKDVSKAIGAEDI